MNEDFIRYMSEQNGLSYEESASLAEKINLIEYKKGDILLREGEFVNCCQFVLSGCVRQYILQDGEEKTTAFFTEKQAVSSHDREKGKVPSRYYLSCVIDSVIGTAALDLEETVYSEFPSLESVTRKTIEEDLRKTQDDFATFITSSPEKRYLNFLEMRPELLDIAPQHQIASYLGMTPESLSRIRKRIATKKVEKNS